MNLLLISPLDDLDSWLGPAQAVVPKYEPLGLLYIAAYVRQQGHAVSVIDCRAENLSYDALKDRIRAVVPDVVGISTLTCSGEFVYHLGRWLKAELPGVTVVLGNIHASVFAREYLLNGCCDVVVHGEGEKPCAEILRCRQEGKPFDCIPSISFLKGGKVVCTGGPAVFEDLSALPLPARDLIDSGNYYLTPASNQTYIPPRGTVVKTISTSRGCLFNCAFCSNYRSIRYNSPKAVVDEMEMLERECHASYICFTDPLFVANKDRVRVICAEIRRRGLKVRWNCEGHVNCLSAELLRDMDAANCHEIALGIESGVQRLLDVVRKGTRLDDVRSAIGLIRANSRIKISGLFILGLPGETRADTLDTIGFAKSLDLDMAQFSVLSPFPGSQIFRELSDAGQLDTGVSPDGTLRPEVWRRYSSYPAFSSQEPIWVTPGRTSAELKQLQKRAYREFYLRPSQLLKHLPRLVHANPLSMLKTAWNFFL